MNRINKKLKLYKKYLGLFLSVEAGTILEKFLLEKPRKNRNF